jgi:thiamine transporter ThiT
MVLTVNRLDCTFVYYILLHMVFGFCCFSRSCGKDVFKRSISFVVGTYCISDLLRLLWQFTSLRFREIGFRCFKFVHDKFCVCIV